MLFNPDLTQFTPLLQILLLPTVRLGNRNHAFASVVKSL